MLPLLDRVAREGQHPVRCRGEQQGTRRVAVAIGVVEQLLRQLRRVVVTPQQLREPLELVQNHQVRLQGIYADAGEAVPEATDDLVAGGDHFARVPVSRAMEPSAEVTEPFDECRIVATFLPEVADQSLLDFPDIDVVDRVFPAFHPGSHAQHVV